MINVMNLRNSKPKHPWDVKIDRSSPLGNPFVMKGESERNFVIAQYKEYFYKNLLRSPELARLISIYKTYGKLNLFCWCAPKACHGDIIKQYIEKELSK